MQTKRDKIILLAIARHWVRMIRTNPTPNNRANLARLFAQRHHVTYDHSPIPCPIWINQGVKL